jgi:lysyl-tRNA synthetase class II
MMFTNRDSIREVLLFPMLRREDSVQVVT